MYLTETKKQRYPFLLIAVAFLAFLLAIAFVPMVGQTADASVSYPCEAHVWFEPCVWDIAPGEDSEEKYTPYIMYQETVQTMLGAVDTVGADDLFGWFTENDFETCLASVQSVAQQVSFYYYNNDYTQYLFNNESAPTCSDPTDSLAVVVYSYGGVIAIDILTQENEEHTEVFYLDDSYTYSTGWGTIFVSYFDETNEKQTKSFSDISNIESDTTTLSGWYFIDSNTEVNNQLVLSDDAHLIFAPEAYLRVETQGTCAIYSDEKTLTIYSCTDDESKFGGLLAYGGTNTSNGAGLSGIHGTKVILASGSLFCQGGDAESRSNANGGDGIYYPNGNVTVYNGVLESTGGNGDSDGVGGNAIFAISFNFNGTGRGYFTSGVNGDNSEAPALQSQAVIIATEGLPLVAGSYYTKEGFSIPYYANGNVGVNEFLMKMGILSINPMCCYSKEQTIDSGYRNLKIGEIERLVRLEKVGENQYKIYQITGYGAERILNLENKGQTVELLSNSESASKAVWNLDENGFYQMAEVTERQRVFLFFYKNITVTKKAYLVLDSSDLWNYVSTEPQKMSVSFNYCNNSHKIIDYEECPTEGCHYGVCEVCGKGVEEKHSYDKNTGYCVCGNADPNYFCTVYDVYVGVEKITETKKVFLFFKKKVTTYKYTIYVSTYSDVPVKSVEYATKKDSAYQDASESFTLSEEAECLYLKIQDANGTVTEWYWNPSELYSSAKSVK